MTHVIRSIPRLLLTISLAALPLFFLGCASQAPKSVEPEAVGEMVWPPPPNPARIRYLGSIRTFEDVTGKPESSLKDTLLGVDSSETRALAKPLAVHGDPFGRVLVADTGARGLLVLDLEAKTVEAWGTSGLGAIAKATGVTSDGDGNVYVSDSLAFRIVKFDRHGNYLLAMGGTDVLASPSGLAFNPVNQRLYVADPKLHQVVVFDPDGNEVDRFGERGEELGNFNFPTNLAVDPATGRVLVADTFNFRIQILEPDGTPVRSFGQVGQRLGDFNRLKGLGVDSEGHIYAVDASFNNFQIFDQEGQLLLYVGEGGHSGPGGFNLPAGAHVDANDRILVADQYNRRVQMFQYLREPTEPSESDD